MKKLLLYCCIALFMGLLSCQKTDNVRAIAPALSWSYDGNTYNASSIQLDYQWQASAYYEVIGTYEDASFIHTLFIGLTSGVAIGSHTVGGYYVHYIVYDKLTNITGDLGFQVYSADVHSFNGDFVSGHFSANNASGPVLTGTFADINSEP